MATEENKKETAKTPAGITNALKNPLGKEAEKTETSATLESAKTPAGRN